MDMPRPDDTEHESQSVELELQIIELLEEYPDVVIDTRAVHISLDLLEGVKQKYGTPGNEGYLPYHNEQHPLKVIKRAWRLWSLLQEEMPERFNDEGYELLMIAGAGHDFVKTVDAKTGGDEKSSAAEVVKRMADADYDDNQIGRVVSAIMATSFERGEDDVIYQTRLRTGGRDPLKLVLATADINGITMEGTSTMLSDAFTLYMEYSRSSVRDILLSPNGLVKFFAYQSQFLQDRLKARSADIDYYFDDAEAEVVRSILDREFTNTAQEALKMAEKLRNQSLAETAIKTTLGKAEQLATFGRENLDKLILELKNLLSK